MILLLPLYAFVACGSDSKEETGLDSVAADTDDELPTTTTGRLTVTEVEGRPEHGTLEYVLTQAISWTDEAYDGRQFLAITTDIGPLSCNPMEWQFVSTPGAAALTINVGAGADPTYGQLAYAWADGSATSAVGQALEPTEGILPPDAETGTAFSGSIQGFLATYATSDNDLNAGDYTADLVGTHCGTINTFTGGR
tara:strand:- start:163 stop:750 length:588 start_codon:yes stop_codon:yes gene_type:complete